MRIPLHTLAFLLFSNELSQFVSYPLVNLFTLTSATRNLSRILIGKFLIIISLCRITYHLDPLVQLWSWIKEKGCILISWRLLLDTTKKHVKGHLKWGPTRNVVEYKAHNFTYTNKSCHLPNNALFQADSRPYHLSFYIWSMISIFSI